MPRFTALLLRALSGFKPAAENVTGTTPNPAASESRPVLSAVETVERKLRITLNNLRNQWGQEQAELVNVKVERGGRNDQDDPTFNVHFNFGPDKTIDIKITSGETTWRVNDDPFVPASEWVNRFGTLGIQVTQRLMTITDVTVRQQFHLRSLLGRPAIRPRKTASADAAL